MVTKSRSRRRAQPSNKPEMEQNMLALGDAPSMNLVVEPVEGELLEEEFSYDLIEDIDAQNLLRNYEGEIRSIIHQSLENVVRLGEIFTIIKEELLPFRQWKAWVLATFKGEVTLNTTHNWMNVYALYKKYSEEYSGALEEISLRDLYVLGRSGVDVEAKEVALELVSDKKVRARDTRTVIETYRKIKLVNAGVEPEVVKMLTKVEVAENPKFVRDIRKLSKTKQEEVAKVLVSGDANSPREALKLIKERNLSHNVTQNEAAEPIVNYGEGVDNTTGATEVNFTPVVSNYSTLSEVPVESIGVAVVEAPLSFDYLDSGKFHDLTKSISDVLIPGGFALITIGHKAAMFAGNAMHVDLKPVHLVCLRRQPGNTSTIIGLNIASASVYMVLAYKAPYRAPKGFLLADLHTLTDSEALPGMDIVETGLEKGFKHLLEPLLSSQPEEETGVLHHVVAHSQHFSIDSFLQETALGFGAKSFVSVL